MVKRKRKPMSILIAVGIAITMVFAVIALGGCNGMIRITNFTEFENLPLTPTRVVFITDFGEGEDFEVDVPQGDIGAVMEKLFARVYRRVSRSDGMDILNCSLRIYDEEAYWTYPLFGFKWLNGRRYKLRQQDDLHSLLMSLAIANRP